MSVSVLGAPRAAPRLCLPLLALPSPAGSAFPCQLCLPLLALPAAGSPLWAAAEPGRYRRGRAGAGGAADKYQRPHCPAACGEPGRLWVGFLVLVFWFFFAVHMFSVSILSLRCARETHVAARGAGEHQIPWERRQECNGQQV